MILKEHRIEIYNHLSGSYRSDIANDVLTGLTAPQKHIPSKYFYDARGSELFDRICGLPEYYPTRTEISILNNSAPMIMKFFESIGGDLVELGSGSNLKIRILLDAADENAFDHLRYVPVDISRTSVLNASVDLPGTYPWLQIKGIVADFTAHLEKIPSDRPRLILFLGSTIGNLDAAARNTFLRLVADSMTLRDRLLIGFDMLKSRHILEAAYNDSLGITSKFNKNVLHVINSKLGADFEPSHFRHLAFFNEEEERVEMHLQAKQRIKVNIRDLELAVEMDKDETVHTEICNKFSRESIERTADETDLKIVRWFFDPEEWFCVAELAKRQA